MKETKIIFEKKRYNQGGKVRLDMCYANYQGYDIQSKRCEEEGVDFIMLGEYRDVARDLREKYLSDWIYYNRLSRIYIDDKQSLDFVKEANKHFKNKIPIHPFFYDIDRSFATYVVSEEPYTRSLMNEYMQRTDDKPKDDLREIKDSQRKLKKRLERREKSKPPQINSDEWTFMNGYYWWIGMVINDGGEQGAYFDKYFKNKIVDKHLPVDEGISLMTLIHEYAHCLDFIESIQEGKVYQVPVGELELAEGYGKKERLQELAKRNRAGETQPTILPTHGEFFVKALASILKAGRTGKIPILNQLEKQVSEIELRIGGREYAEKERNEIRMDFQAKMQKRLELQNTPYLRFGLPKEFNKFLSESEMSYVNELDKKQIDVDVALDLLPYVVMFQDSLKDSLEINPRGYGKILDQMTKVRNDIMRLIRRLGS